MFSAIQGSAILCKQGRVWITAERNPVDWWLEPGDAMIVPGDGAVVIEADSVSRVVVSRSRPLRLEAHAGLSTVAARLAGAVRRARAALRVVVPRAGAGA